MKKLIFCMVLLTPGFIWAQDKPETEERQFEIPKLIDELGAADWKNREAAQEQLKKMGKAVLPQLQEALKNAKDLEQVSRLEELIQGLGGEKPKEVPKDELPPLEELPLPIPETPSLEDMMDQLGNLGELTPQLQEKIDSLKDLMDKGNNGNLDLEALKKIFESFVNPGTPQLPSSEADRFDKQFGIQSRPVDDVLRSHIRLSPISGNPDNWDRIEYGLVIEQVEKGSMAEAWGLKQHDIVVFASEQEPPKVALPGPQRDWDAWRGRAAKVGTPRQLEFLLTKPGYLEVIRRGQSCNTLKITSGEKAPDEKKERGF